MSNMTPEVAMRKIQRIFKKRGTKALETAIKEMLQETIESKEASKALTYFMTQYWHDLARPALLSMVCQAVGGDPEDTTPIGVPMILISGAISIHDDIIDETKAKTGYPTIYGKFGREMALLVGDALLFKGFFLLNTAREKGLPGEKMSAVAEIIKNMFFELGDAEAMELHLRGRIDVLPRTYLRVVKKKAADVEAHTRIGAVIGSGSKEEVEAMGHFGRLLGMMIILRDDWIDLMDPEESRHRIKKESLPIPVLYALQDPQVNSELKTLILQRSIGKRDAQTILETVCKSKARRRYLGLMRRLAAEANSKLKSIEHKSVRHLELLIEATLPPSTKMRTENRKLRRFAPPESDW